MPVDRPLSDLNVPVGIHHRHSGGATQHLFYAGAVLLLVLTLAGLVLMGVGIAPLAVRFDASVCQLTTFSLAENREVSDAPSSLVTGASAETG